MAEEIPGEARQWAMACHLIALVGLIGNIIGFGLGPLIVWLLKKDDHPFIDEQGKEALNFQITMFIALAISFLLTVVFFIGFVLLIIVGLFMTIFPIIAAFKVTDSVHYRYPFSIRFVK
jgi:uncharacterized Tic20 family protein